MALADGFTIDVPAVLGVQSRVGGLVSTGSGTAGQFGAAALDAAAFAGIGSEVAGAEGALQRGLTAALQQLLRVLGETSGAVGTAANGYAELDQRIAAMLGGGTDAGTTATAAAIAAGGDNLTALRKAGSPAAVRQRWDALSADQQHQLIQAHPKEIGALDGIPVVARDQANRIVLGTLHQQADNDLRAARADRDSAVDNFDLGAGFAAQSRIDADTKQLDALNHLQTVLGNRSTPQYLLGVDTTSPGHWIVAAGNPDTAQHVLTLVPGMQTSLSAGSIDGLNSHASNLLQAAGTAAPGESTSVITWAGYHSPQNVQALDASYARAGAGALQSFQQGLYATHDPGAFTTTVAAHSYGTLVATDAATAPGGLLTDALAYLDSPGVPTTTAASLGIKHVFATATTNDAVVNGSDFIGRLGAYEYNGNLPPGQAPIANPQDQAFHGVDPLSPSFGAIRFDAGTGTTGLFNGITAHSDVFNPAYPGPANIGRIATGHYEAITGPQRH